MRNSIDTTDYSEAARTSEPPQDWTAHVVDTLRSCVQGHPDRAVEWNIPFGDFAGVNPASAPKVCIGVGDRDYLQRGGEGLICIDGIQLVNLMP